MFCVICRMYHFPSWSLTMKFKCFYYLWTGTEVQYASSTAKKGFKWFRVTRCQGKEPLDNEFAWTVRGQFKTVKKFIRPGSMVETISVRGLPVLGRLTCLESLVFLVIWNSLGFGSCNHKSLPTKQKLVKHWQLLRNLKVTILELDT